MTDKKRAPRNSKPMSAHDAVGKIRAIYADQGRRIAALCEEDNAKARAIGARVQGADETYALNLMLNALGIDLAAQPTNAEIAAEAPDDAPDSADDVPSRPANEEYAVPERLLEPLSPERMAVGRKR